MTIKDFFNILDSNILEVSKRLDAEKINENAYSVMFKNKDDIGYQAVTDTKLLLVKKSNKPYPLDNVGIDIFEILKLIKYKEYDLDIFNKDIDFFEKKRVLDFDKVMERESDYICDINFGEVTSHSCKILRYVTNYDDMDIVFKKQDNTLYCYLVSEEVKFKALIFQTQILSNTELDQIHAKLRWFFSAFTLLGKQTWKMSIDNKYQTQITLSSEDYNLYTTTLLYDKVLDKFETIDIKGLITASLNDRFNY